MVRLFSVIAACWLLMHHAASAQVVSDWLTPNDGTWIDATNWSTDPVAPVTSVDEAMIAVASSPYTVTIDSPVAIDRLTIDSPDAEVLIDGGSLSVASGVAANAGPLVLGTGLVENTRLSGSAGVVARDVGGGYVASELRNVTLATTLQADPESPAGFVRLDSSLTLDGGRIDLSNGLDLFTEGSLDIGGSGVISTGSPLSGSHSATWRFLASGGAGVTIGPGVTVRAETGSRLYLHENNFPSGRADYVNNGVLEADGGGFSFNNDIDFFGAGGTLRAINGGTIRMLATRGDVGQIDLGADSSIQLESGGFSFSQPFTIPEAAELKLKRGSWMSETTITVDRGTLVVNGGQPVTGTWNWLPGSTLAIDGVIPYSRLSEYSVAPDTRIAADDRSSYVIDLGTDRLDLAALPGVFDLQRVAFRGGEISALPAGEAITDAEHRISLDSTVIDTPIRVEAGNLTIQDSETRQPITLTGGTTELRGAWVNNGGVTVRGGRLQLRQPPDMIGSISLESGTVVLTEMPTDPSELTVSGGTIELENSTDTTYTLTELRVLPWTPRVYAAGTRSTFDLEWATYDLSAEPFEVGFGGEGSFSKQIRNGTILKSTDDGPWQIGSGVLSDITLQTDLETSGFVQMSGSITVQGSRLIGDYDLAGTSDATLDGTSIEGSAKVGRFYGTPSDVAVRNGLTVNGSVDLGTRFLAFDGSQTIVGAGELFTDGIRGAPGGGIRATGTLTIDSGITFRSARNGSRIEVESGDLINHGNLIADTDDYANGQDVPAPSITISLGESFSSGRFIQNGLLEVADGYEVRVESNGFENAGEIELRGGLLDASTNATVPIDNAGELRGDGAIIAFGSEGLLNRGTVRVGDHGVPEGAPDESIGLLQLVGDYRQTDAGQLLIDLAGAEPGIGYDRLVVSGEASLDGSLIVTLDEGFAPATGQAFELLTAGGGLLGEFADVSLPSLDQGRSWQVDYLPTSLVLRILGLPGDYNADGLVSQDDLAAYHQEYGAEGVGLAADGNGDGRVDAADYTIWRDAFLEVQPNTVPEPASVALIAMTFACSATRRRREA